MQLDESATFKFLCFLNKYFSFLSVTLKKNVKNIKFYSFYKRFAETHNSTELADEALAHAQANWNLVANGDELLELPLQQLITLLSSEQLKVDNEAQVLLYM